MMCKRQFLIHFVIASMLFLVMFRDMLTNPGLIIYRDFSWPYTRNILLRHPDFFNLYAYSAHGRYDINGVFRTIVTWPTALLGVLQFSPSFVERVFFYLLFLLVYFLFYFSVTLLWKRVALPQNETLKILVIFISMANFYALNVVTWWTLWLGFGLMAFFGVTLLYAFSFEDRKWFALSAGSWFIATLLDPRLGMWMFFYLVAVFLVQYLTFKKQRKIIASTMTRMLLLYMLLALIPGLTLLGFFANHHAYKNLRDAPISTFIATFSSKSTFSEVVRLLGYAWPQVDFMPLNEQFSGLWSISTFVVPLFAFSTLLIPRASIRRLSISYAIIAIIGIFLSTGTQQPGSIIANIIVAGEKIVPSGLLSLYYGLFRVSDPHIGLIALSYSLLIALFVGYVGEKARSRGKEYWKRIIASIMLCVLVFASLFSYWQFFTGSLAPSGPLNNGSSVKNAVGVLYPGELPEDILEAYSWVESRNGQFNVVWLPWTSGFAYTWNQKASPTNEILISPKPVVALDYLADAIKNNSSENVALTLRTLNVKYVVVSDHVETPALKEYFGVEDINDIVEYLKAQSGLELTRVSEHSWIFEVSNCDNRFDLSRNTFFAVSEQNIGVFVEVLTRLNVTCPAVFSVEDYGLLKQFGTPITLIDESLLLSSISTDATWNVSGSYLGSVAAEPSSDALAVNYKLWANDKFTVSQTFSFPQNWQVFDKFNVTVHSTRRNNLLTFFYYENCMSQWVEIGTVAPNEDHLTYSFMLPNLPRLNVSSFRIDTQNVDIEPWKAFRENTVYVTDLTLYNSVNNFGADDTPETVENQIIILEPALASFDRLRLVNGAEYINGNGLETLDSFEVGCIADELRIHRTDAYSLTFRVKGQGGIKIVLTRNESEASYVNHVAELTINNSALHWLETEKILLEKGRYTVDFTLSGGLTFDFFALSPVDLEDLAGETGCASDLQWEQTSPVSYLVSFQTDDACFLIFKEPWDPNWVATDQNGNSYTSFRVLDAVNGFLLPQGGCYRIRYVASDIALYAVATVSAVSLLLFLSVFNYVGVRVKIVKNVVRVVFLFIFVFLIINTSLNSLQLKTWSIVSAVAIAVFYVLWSTLDRKQSFSFETAASCIAHALLLVLLGYSIAGWINGSLSAVVPFAAWVFAVLEPFLMSVLKKAVLQKPALHLRR